MKHVLLICLICVFSKNLAAQAETIEEVDAYASDLAEAVREAAIPAVAGPTVSEVSEVPEPRSFEEFMAQTATPADLACAPELRGARRAGEREMYDKFRDWLLVRCSRGGGCSFGVAEFELLAEVPSE